MDDKITLGLVCLGGALVTGTALVTSLIVGVGDYNSRKTPSADVVQQGYIDPSRVEIKVEDSDGNGEPETILMIGEESYALRYDADGKPTLTPYDVEPAEIRYKGK